MKIAFCLLVLASLVSVAQGQTSTFIYGYAGVGPAVVKIAGPQTVSVTSDAQGFYLARSLPAGNYVITPTASGYTFSPTNRAVGIGNPYGGSVATANFTATPTASAPKVHITTLLASPASVTLSTAGATQQLKTTASYSDGTSQDVTHSATYASNSTSVATVSQTGLITALAKGTATVIASYGGLAASVGIAVNISTPTYSISGSTGVASAAVSLSGATSAKTTASSTGAYSFTNLPAGSYTITPSATGYTFTPASQSKAITTANLTGVNFTGTATAPHLVDLTWAPGSIKTPAPGQVIVGYNVYRASASGGPYTLLNSSPVVGLTYTDRAVSAGQTWYYVCSTVDNLGNISVHSSSAVATIP
jgi:hypothetical protein